MNQRAEVLAQKGFTSGQPNLVDPGGDCNSRESFDLFEAEYFSFRFPLVSDGRLIFLAPSTPIEVRRGFRFGETIQATKVATVGDTNPEITNRTSV